MRLINGYLLIKPDVERYDGVKVGDKKIFISKLHNEAYHQIVTGFVVAIPMNESEIRVGDEIIFHYRDYPYALDDRRVDADGNFFLKRTDPYLIIRGGVEIAINETVIVEPDDDFTFESDVIKEYASHFKKKKSLNKGKVRLSAEVVTDGVYRHIKPGSHVYFDKVDSIPLQPEMYQKIASGKTLYRMKHTDVLAILP